VKSFDRQMKVLAVLLFLLLCVVTGRFLYDNDFSSAVSSQESFALGGIVAPPEVSDITVLLQDQDGLLNINEATLEELQILPNIGPVKAQAILEYRASNGSFADKEDLMKVKGIGKATYEKVQEYICVE